MNGKRIGRCSFCDQMLYDYDIQDFHFRGTARTHHAYVCMKCGHIIGFSASQ